MIKVGQVWQDTHNPECNVVITRAYKFSKAKLYDYIYPDGTTVSEDDEYFIKVGRKLIAEYLTWVEAVNSEEFKVGGK